MLQNYLVVQDGARYLALGDVTRAVLHESPAADAAIQAAVDALGPGGGAVTLGRGRFTLRAPVRIGAPVWLRGSGHATRLVVAAENQEGVGVLVAGARAAAVSDLTVQPEARPGGAAGVVLEACADCTVRAVRCLGFAGCGVWVRAGAQLCRVEGCSLGGNETANLLLEQLREGPLGSYLPTMVSGCVTYGGGAGVVCSRAIGVSISGCLVHQPRGPAYHVHSRSNGAALVGSRSYQVSGDAVLVERSDEVTITGNTLCWHTGDGVAVRGSRWGTVSGNQIVDSGSYNPGGPDRSTPLSAIPAGTPGGCGVRLLGASGFQVTGNTIFNWGVAPPLALGIWEDQASERNSITSNSVNYVRGPAVLLEGRGTLGRDNGGLAEHPYGDPPAAERMLQSFQAELTSRFLDLQAELEAP